MLTVDFYFESSDERTTIHGVKFLPDNGEYKACIQIVHGMTEHIMRYKDFAEFLTNYGIMVIGHDQLGHGDSIVSKEDYGFFADNNPGNVLIRDIHMVRKYASAELRDVPYFMFGHSMGSYLLRRYLSSHGDGLAGAIIMGTGYVDKFRCRSGLVLIKKLIKEYGGHYRSNLCQALTFSGSYLKYDMSGKDVTRNFCTKDVDIVKLHMADEKSNFQFTVNGFYGLVSTVLFTETEKYIDLIPKDLPMILVSGDMDPVGDMGKGVRKVYDLYNSAGIKDLKMTLYEADRHELLFELDREKVYDDLLEWIFNHI
ncbi:MAG: alpha/beta hydrolase [Lachnospiraceae bacterium]|nr:alpha/beta hydrolase [Lachnospiraceae bacterium]